MTHKPKRVHWCVTPPFAPLRGRVLDLAPQYHRETNNYKTADIEAPAAEGHTAESGKKPEL
jgi:hypothetical protein